MNGMLMKEFLYLKGQKRTLYSVLIIAVILYITMLSQSKAPTPIEYAGFLGVLMAMLAATETFNGVASDEKAKWDTYARSLPVGICQSVGAKYLFTLILSAAGMVIGALILLAVTKGQAGADALLILCVVTGGISILLCSIELPLFYKFGMQKSNLVVILVFCLGPLLLGKIFGSAKVPFSDAQFFTALKLSPLILLAVMAVSFFISCSIYSHKEA